MSVQCACGCYVGKYYLKKHLLTNKHKKLMERIVPPVNRIMSMSEVISAMNSLEEKIDEISSGEYLIECNRLKEIYDRLKRREYLASIGVN